MVECELTVVIQKGNDKYGIFHFCPQPAYICTVLFKLTHQWWKKYPAILIFIYKIELYSSQRKFLLEQFSSLTLPPENQVPGVCNNVNDGWFPCRRGGKYTDEPVNY